MILKTKIGVDFLNCWKRLRELNSNGSVYYGFVLFSFTSEPSEMTESESDICSQVFPVPVVSVTFRSKPEKGKEV